MQKPMAQTEPKNRALEQQKHDLIWTDEHKENTGHMMQNILNWLCL